MQATEGRIRTVRDEWGGGGVVRNLSGISPSSPRAIFNNKNVERENAGVTGVYS